MGARVCVTGHWRARGGKAAQSGESVTEWLLVAHTVRVLTAAPSVHGVRSVLDAARRGTMSAPAAAAALVYAAEGAAGAAAAEGSEAAAAEGSEAAAAEGSEGGEGVAALVTEYAARDEPSAEQAPLGARDERVVEELLRQLRAALPPAIARLAISPQPCPSPNPNPNPNPNQARDRDGWPAARAQGRLGGDAARCDLAGGGARGDAAAGRAAGGGGSP